MNTPNNTNAENEPREGRNENSSSATNSSFGNSNSGNNLPPPSELEKIIASLNSDKSKTLDFESDNPKVSIKYVALSGDRTLVSVAATNTNTSTAKSNPVLKLFLEVSPPANEFQNKIKDIARDVHQQFVTAEKDGQKLKINLDNIAKNDSIKTHGLAGNNLSIGSSDGNQMNLDHVELGTAKQSLQNIKFKNTKFNNCYWGRSCYNVQFKDNCETSAETTFEQGVRFRHGNTGIWVSSTFDTDKHGFHWLNKNLETSSDQKTQSEATFDKIGFILPENKTLWFGACKEMTLVKSSDGMCTLCLDFHGNNIPRDVSNQPTLFEVSFPAGEIDLESFQQKLAANYRKHYAGANENYLFEANKSLTEHVLVKEILEQLKQNKLPILNVYSRNTCIKESGDIFNQATLGSRSYIETTVEAPMRVDKTPIVNCSFENCQFGGISGRFQNTNLVGCDVRAGHIRIHADKTCQIDRLSAVGSTITGLINCPISGDFRDARLGTQSEELKGESFETSNGQLTEKSLKNLSNFVISSTDGTLALNGEKIRLSADSYKVKDIEELKNIPNCFKILEDFNSREKFTDNFSKRSGLIPDPGMASDPQSREILLEVNPSAKIGLNLIEDSENPANFQVAVIFYKVSETSGNKTSLELARSEPLSGNQAMYLVQNAGRFAWESQLNDLLKHIRKNFQSTGDMGNPFPKKDIETAPNEPRPTVSETAAVINPSKANAGTAS